MVIDFSQSWLSTYYTSIGKKGHGPANRIVNRQLKRLSLRVVQYTQSESDGRRPRTFRLTGSQFAKYTKYRVADWVEHVGKRPDSIGSDGDGLPWQEYIGLTAC